MDDILIDQHVMCASPAEDSEPETCIACDALTNCQSFGAGDLVQAWRYDQHGLCYDCFIAANDDLVREFGRAPYVAGRASL